MPGELTIFQIDWISVFDLELNENFGSVLIPGELNVPPSLIKIQVIDISLVYCIYIIIQYLI